MSDGYCRDIDFEATCEAEMAGKCEVKMAEKKLRLLCKIDPLWNQIAKSASITVSLAILFNMAFYAPILWTT